MRQIVITGATGGLGRALASEIVGRGDAAILVDRDPEGGAALVAELGRRGPGPASLIVADLASVAGVRALAAAIRELPGIDVLIHNAGVWPSARVRTVDGVETAFQVNHLAPFLLNALLEERLLARRARVIQVSADVYPLGRVDLLRTPTGADFSPLRTYANTILSNLLCTRLWAARWRERAPIDAIHPGVLRTGLGDRSGLIGWLLGRIKRRWAPPIDGARAIDRLIDEHGHGRYFTVNHEVGFAAVACESDLASALWADAARRCGCDLPAPEDLAWAALDPASASNANLH